jgi:uncharacterized protein YdaU (DUF1376 family)
MPLYIADYMRDTSHLRALESGAYLHLIMAYWVSGRLPNCDRQLATIAKLTDKEWKACKPTLAGFFGPDFSSHKRIDAELVKVADISSKRRASAMQRHSKTDAIAYTLHTTHTQRKKEEEKKEVRATRGTPLPEGWSPSDDDLSYGEKLGLSRSQVLDAAEEMRLWAGANSNRAIGRKADWSLTFQGWMRRNRKRGSNGQTARDESRNDFRTALRKLREFGESEVGGDDGGNVVRLLPPAGSG